jgi:hypothetical protein
MPAHKRGARLQGEPLDITAGEDPLVNAPLHDAARFRQGSERDLLVAFGGLEWRDERYEKCSTPIGKFAALWALTPLVT